MTDPKTAKSNSMVRRLIPGVLLGVVVLIALALVSDLRQVGENMSRFNWAVYPPALLLTLFNYTLRFFKWDFYLRQLGVKNLSKRESARLFVAGFPLAVTPGKVGEALKAVWLRQATGLPVARGISVVLAERISDGIAVALLSVAGVFAYPRYWPAFAAIAAALVAVVVVSQIRPAALGLLNLGARLPLVKRFVPGLREFYEGSYALFRPGPTLVAVLLGTVSWLGEGVGFYLILLGLGLPPSLQLAALAVFILSFSTIIGAASALPGGLGAAEVSIAGMLALLANVSPALATTATLLIRLATLWFGVALGLLTWAWSRDLLGLKGENGTTVES